jgi:hypothetical protein
MDYGPATMELIEIALLTILLSALLALLTSMIGESRLSRAIAQARGEPSSLRERYFVSEDHPLWQWIAGPVGYTALVALFDVLFFYTHSLSMGPQDLGIYIEWLLGLGLGVSLLLSLAQIWTTSTFYVVSERGIDERTFSSSGRSSGLLTLWNEIAVVTTMEKRGRWVVDLDYNMRFAIRSSDAQMRLRANWVNFDLLAKEVLRFVPDERIGPRAKRILRKKAARAELKGLPGCVA